MTKTLDALGEEGCTLEEALEQIFADLKRRGIAVETINLAADEEADAQFNLGGLRINGEGVPQGDTQAVFWYRNAAEQGLRRKHRLYFDDTDQHSPEDYTRLAAWLRKAAEQGDAEAQFTFGYLYDKGQGVFQDYAQAVYWYRKAAEQGFALAQDTLGVLYDNGLGVPQDYTQAAAWYRKAAEQGNADAQSNLGYLYASGLGVPQDYTQAAAWYCKSAEQDDYAQAALRYRKAAEQGDAWAQYNLGVLYYKGRGVPQDFAKAYFWSDLAAAGKLNALDMERVAKLRDDSASILTPAELSREQERLRKWFEAHQAKPQ
jgi:hypothetical protein